MIDPFDIVRWINIVALSGLYSTAEALVLGVPGGVRSVTVLFVALVAVILVYVPMVESGVTALRRRKQFKGLPENK